MPAKEHFLRDQSKLHTVFAVSCIIMLVSTIWMMVQDQTDEWRAYQRKGFRLSAAAKERDINSIRTTAYIKEADKLQNQQSEVDELLQNYSGLAAELSAARDSAVRNVERLSEALKSQGAIRDEKRADYNLDVRDLLPTAESMAAFEAEQDKVDELQLQVEQAQKELGLIGVPDPQLLVEYLTRELATAEEAAAKAQGKFRQTVEAGADEREFTSVKTARDEAEALVQRRQSELSQARESVRLSRVEQAAPGAEPSEQQIQEVGQLFELKRLFSMKADIKSQIDKLLADENLLRSALEKENPSAVVHRLKRWSMEQPILDGFNSHLKVQQDWLPNLFQTLGMTSIARFDRCRTCHMNADKTLPGNLPAFSHGDPASDKIDDWIASNAFPHPFATHPNPELYVTASSPHPVGEFGCTICHDGQGSGTSFGNAEHTPNDPHVQDEWEHEYGYHPNHFWEYPMLPDRFKESGCIKCHHSVTELEHDPKFGNSAPKVTRGFNLIKKYGCFGCHEIHGFDAGLAIGPDMRLEPQTEADAQRIAEDARQHAGLYRKVGPSLRHIAAKSGADFIAHWTQNPSRYRPTTKMPRFFGLSNQQGEDAKAYEAVELAGVAQLLTGLSEEIELLSPADDYEPDIERGKMLFTEKGCLACHTHDAVQAPGTDFGPNISDIHRKVKRNTDDPNFSDWLYTWIRDPTKYHKRTKMGVVFYDFYEGGNQPTEMDPAADIAAYLLSLGPAETFETPEFSDGALDRLLELFLRKSRFSKDAVDKMLTTQQFPQKKGAVKGDEAALATADGTPTEDAAEWKRKKLEYIGRRTVSRYGCYGCHDIAGFEDARPIGAALHDWGRKDTSKLGLEHIEEYLHHGGEPADSEFTNTVARVEHALNAAAGGGLETQSFRSREEEERELSAAYFYESLLHHGRPGFVWQKLRDPRSYDYMAEETKGYDELLRMPKFPMQEDEMEAIATFVLGLVAEPPAKKYIYQPDERSKNRIEGEFLLAKYNCTACHMVELPQVTFGVDIEQDILATEMSPADHQTALDLLLKLKPPRQALTGKSDKFVIDGEEVELPLASFHGLRMVLPDPEEEDPDFIETGFDVYETLDFGEGDKAKRLLPSSRQTVSNAKLVEYQEGRGGRFAEWLVDHLVENKTEGNRQLAWQASPPPLYQEGEKVQTPWLFDFLREPETLRYTTVLRMPRFNMSIEDARVLANYFAAVDGAEFPYQEQQSTDKAYLTARQQELTDQGMLVNGEDYLHEGWLSVNGTLCIKCHNVGGRRFKVSDPKKDVQGPDLNRVQRRLRSDWVKLWLYKPTWITPYTSMPVNFPHNNSTQFPDLYEGDPGAQVEGTADALLNYTRLMEEVGPVTYEPPKQESPADSESQANADEAADPEKQLQALNN